VAGRITQHSTGRQKKARFLPVGKLLVKGRYRFKSYSFFAFAACELNRYEILGFFITLKIMVRGLRSINFQFMYLAST